MKRRRVTKGVRVKNPDPQQLAPSDVVKTDEWEEWVVRNADYFTMCQRVGPGQVQTQEFKTLAAAIVAKGENVRGMVYACTKSGRSIMVGPKQFEKFLSIRREVEGR